MSKYKNFHVEKPDLNKLIVWIGPPGAIEVYGHYKGNLMFMPLPNQSRPGFVAKYWRYATDAEIMSYDLPVQPIKLKDRKRKYK